MLHPARFAAPAVAVLLLLPSTSTAQTFEGGAKIGINSSSVNAVPDYYDWLLCCHPLDPNAMVDARSATGFTAGGFAGVRFHRWFAVQGEMLFSRKRHAVDLRPYEAIQITFTRDYIETAGLAKLQFPVADENQIYVAGGPVLAFRVGEDAASSDATLRRGNPETDIYALQALIYSAPEVLETSQTSLALAAGWESRKFLIEVRLTHGLQSLFKDREAIVSAFLKLGGHEPTLRRLILDFGPILESTKSRDVAVLAGFRF
jgi:outer membrane protein with beta-barrel domain